MAYIAPPPTRANEFKYIFGASRVTPWAKQTGEKTAKSMKRYLPSRAVKRAAYV